MSNHFTNLSSCFLTVLTRLEAGLLSVNRSNFYLIDEFDLNQQAKVNFTEHGDFKCSPTDLRTKEPEKHVADYLIRTAYSSCVMMKSERKKQFDAKKDTLDFPKLEAENFANERKKKSNDNIFHITSFQPSFLYGLYHNLTIEHIEGDKKINDDWSGNAEVFQLVMVASKMLEHMFKDEMMSREKMKANLDSYINAYGSEDEAMKKAHLLEASMGALPTSNKIPKDQFRRVINSNYASIACFFALAIYDEDSFRFAHCLILEPRTGIRIPHMQRLFGDGLVRMRNDTEEEEKSITWLFEHKKMDDGPDFVKQVVDVLNRLAHFMECEQRCFGTSKKVYDKTRIEALFFRTLASDLAEIYVTHSRNPLIKKEWKEWHPWLSDLVKHNKQKHPVNLLLEYIMLAIDQGKIQVEPSHMYNSQKKLATQIGPEQTTPGVPIPKDGRPKTRDIRYLYKLMDAKKVTPSTKERQEYLEWLKLTEVVNVILFATKNPFVKEGEPEVFIEWYHNLPAIDSLENKKVEFWKGKKEKKEENDKSRNRGIQG